MKLIVIILLVFCYSKIDAQIIYDKGHGKFIKTTSKIVMPKIIDKDFCQKITSIITPDSINFNDEGRVSYYFIQIYISLSNKGAILSIKHRNNKLAIAEIANHILDLLKKAKWKVVTKKKKLEIVFRCELRERNFENIVLSTKDNSQREKICK